MRSFEVLEAGVSKGSMEGQRQDRKGELGAGGDNGEVLNKASFK